MLSLTQVVQKLRDKTLSYFDLKNQGGGWLGVARNWIQCKFINGDNVTWSSDEILRIHGALTVRDIESFAARVALATLEEYSSSLVTEGEKAALKAYMDKESWVNYTPDDIDQRNIVFVPGRDKLHFKASFFHQHGWDLPQIIDSDVRERKNNELK